MTGWSLAIDFGSTSTAAAIVADGRVSLLDLDGATTMPSTVLLDDDGSIVVGRAAETHAPSAPDRVDRSPKRSLGRTSVLVLGRQPVPVVDVVAAVLSHVSFEATRRRGGTQPDRVVLTHPVRWGDRRLDALRDAAHRAELAPLELVAEPVAAAMHYADETVESGECVAVYDLGGGTFDAAVLRRTEDGFELAGQPGGTPEIGGEQFDDLLFRHVGETLADVAPDAWEQIQHDASRPWRQHAAELRSSVRTAKEALSSFTQHDIYVTAADTNIRMTRAELEGVLGPPLRDTVDELTSTIARAGLRTEDLAAVYLVGGSSRIPLVGRLISEALDRVPVTYDDPKSVVVLGATRVVSPIERPVPAEVQPPAPATEPPSDARAPDRAPAAALAVPEIRATSGAATPRRRGVAITAALIAAVVAVAAIGFIVTRDGGDDNDDTVPAAAADEEFECAADAAPAAAAPVAATVLFATTTDGAVRARPFATAGALVVATETGRVTSFATDGTENWSVDLATRVVSDLAGTGELVVVAGDSGHLRALALAPAPGVAETRWEVDLGQPLGNPTVSGDTVYVGGAGGRIFAVDVANGTKRWDMDVDGAVFGAPVVHDGRIYAATTAGRVIEAALDSHEIDAEQELTTGSEAGPVVVGDSLIVGAVDGSVHAFSTAALEPVWNVQASSASQPVYASLAAEGDRVFVGSTDCGLYALNAATGEGVWRHAAAGAFDTTLTASQGVYASSDDGVVVALGPDGQARWQHVLDAPPTAPAVADGRVYVATLNGAIVALQAT